MTTGPEEAHDGVVSSVMVGLASVVITRRNQRENTRCVAEARSRHASPLPVRFVQTAAVSAVILVLVLAAGCAARARLPSSWVADEVPNYRVLGNGLATANAITSAAIPKLATAGFKTIIDLRLPSERGVTEEAAAVERAGMRYVQIPVALTTLSGAHVRAVADILDTPANRPVLMHCSSGNRTGAVLELYRERIHGVDHDAARDEARAVGLQMPDAIEAVERVGRQMQLAD